MVEKVLVEFSYGIDEEIVKEDNGFVHKIISNDEEIVKNIEKASKTLEKDLTKVDSTKLETADEKLKPLMEVFMNNKDKITYSFDVFDNGVIRIFETEDPNLVEQLHNAADTLKTTEEEKSKAEASAAEKPAAEEEGEIEEWDPEKERALAEQEKAAEKQPEEEKSAEEPYLHVNTITDYILKSDKYVMIFYVNPEKEESKELIAKIDEYRKKFEKVKVKTVNVTESVELDEILKIRPLETPIVVLYGKEEEQIKELARLKASEIKEENLAKMANIK